MRQVTIDIDDDITYQGKHATIYGQITFAILENSQQEYIVGRIIDINATVRVDGEEVADVPDEITLTDILTIRQKEELFNRAAEKIEGAVRSEAEGRVLGFFD